MDNGVVLICGSDLTPIPKRPCPFCGEVAQRVKKTAGNRFQVECENCGARGPIYGDALSAKKGWKFGEGRAQIVVDEAK